MDLRLKIRYYSGDKKWLCFQHAVLLATQGVDVLTDIDDYNSDWFNCWCVECGKEKEPVTEVQVVEVLREAFRDRMVSEARLARSGRVRRSKNANSIH